MTRPFTRQPPEVGVVGAMLAGIFAAVLFIACAYSVRGDESPDGSTGSTAGSTTGVGVGVSGS